MTQVNTFSWKIKTASREVELINGKFAKAKKRQSDMTEKLKNIQNHQAILDIHSDRLYRYARIKFGHIVGSTRREAAAITQLMAMHIDGCCIARAMSIAIGDDHDEYMKRLADLGENQDFING